MGSMYAWTAQLKGIGKAKVRRLQLKRDSREYDSSKRFSYINGSGNDHDCDRRYGHNKGL
jgi:hypothetical protein